MSYSINQLTSLAKNNPKELSRILSTSNVNVQTLTDGVEILGDEVKDEELVLPVLRKLLKHFNAVVREGAMIGVSSFFMSKKPPQDILDRLEIIFNNDPSPACKTFAESLIDEFKKA